MWIRSQNKENLMNNPLRIYIMKCCENTDDFEIKATTYDECICLGIYNSKERALEVLDEIEEYVKNNLLFNFKSNSECEILPINKIYQMPKEY